MLTRKQIIESEFRIINKEKELTDFKQNYVQDKLDEVREELKRLGKPVKILILKARQEGVSVKVMADWTADCVNPEIGNLVAVLVSHEGEATKRLFRKAKIYIDHSKTKISTKTDNSKEIEFPETNSWFYILTAGSKAGGRGDTIHRLHLSEVAHYQDQSILVGLFQSVTKNGEVICETTANGYGEWFQIEWERAKKGESPFYPLFFSWADNPEYRIKNPLVDEANEEERVLMNAFKLDIEQIAWRREKIKEFPNKELFMQEYPLTPEEAFIHSGTPAFDVLALKTYIKNPPKIGMFVDKGDRIVFEPKEQGWWRVWQGPEIGEQYYGFLDPAEGKDTSEARDPDYAVIEIYNHNLKQCAELQKRLTPAESARQLALAGKYYNEAYIGWELNNSGHAVSVVVPEIYSDGRIYKQESGDMGWRTTEKSRKVLIDGLADMIAEHDIEIQSEWTINEMFSFVLNKNGKYEAQKGTHDDCVISTGGVVQMYKSKPLKQESAIKRQLRDRKKKHKLSYTNRDND